MFSPFINRSFTYTMQPNCFYPYPYLLYPNLFEQNMFIGFDQINQNILGCRVCQKSSQNDMKSNTQKSEQLQEEIEEFQENQLSDIQVITKIKRKQSVLKNTQTNIINQLFSYLSKPEKSLQDLNFILNKNSQKIKIFYAYMKSLKRIKGKYLNRKYLYNLVFLPEKTPENKMVTRSKYRNKILGLDELKRVMVRIVLKFLRGPSILTLIQSNRIKDNTLTTHLQKRRNLINQIISKSKLLKLNQ